MNERRKEKGSTGAVIKKLLGYLRPFRMLLVLSLILSAASAVLTVISPEFLSRITDEIQMGITGQMNLGNITKIAVTYTILIAIAAVFGYFQSYVMTLVTLRTSQKMRSDISHKIDQIPLSYCDTHSYGDTLSRVTNDVDTLSSTLNSSVSSVFSGAVTLLGCMVMMFATNWIMALSGIFSSLIGFAISMVIAAKSQAYFLSQQQELGDLNGQIEEVFSGHTVVKAFNNQKTVAAEFHERNSRLYSSTWKAQFLSGLMMPVMGLVGNLGYVVVCIAGAVLVLNGQIGIATIVAFMMYIRLFTNPLSSLAQAAGSLQSAVASGTRVFELLDTEELSDESSKTTVLSQVEGNVRFDHVHFGYDPSRMILTDFSANIKAGQKIAIVGPTGAGKTTMVNLLMRFYEVNQGHILVDNTPLDRLTRENVSNLFGMVLQDTWLFEGTVRDNIAYGSRDISDEELKRVCKAVGLHHFIKTLPLGYDTVLDEKTTLSVGQKQLMTIARAMVEDAPLLILDEATSSVDTRTEKMIQRAIDQLTEGRTSFVIAHRLSTIKNADLILVMKDGNIVETGSHTELLEKGGLYAELYNSQFEPAA